MKKALNKWQLILLLLAICTYSCSDDKDSGLTPFDPSKDVIITGFTPEEGGAYQQLLIYGENFGTDASIVSVTIGGEPAVIVSVTGTSIYCFVPTKAYSGIIEVTIDDGDHVKKVTASKPFAYTKEMMVGTLCGYRNKDDDQGWDPGPFSSCSGFRNDACMMFDPLNKNHLYICYDGHNFVQVIDLQKREVRNAFNVGGLGLNSRVRSIDFTKASTTYGKEEAQYMVITFDYSDKGLDSPNVYLVERSASGTFDDTSEMTCIAKYKECNGASVHPNGEIYFNSHEQGQVFRLDLEDYYADPVNWNANVENNKKIEKLFTIADPSWEFKIFIHPTGSYAYLVVINQHYILRTDYNPATKKFVTPYVVAGGYKVSGYVDDVGINARMNRPYQGVFVKNKEYTKGDQYDFYFADRENFCIRLMTPDGVVTTYAGRGTTSVNSDNSFSGTDDGALRTTARFKQVTGIAYDEENEIFYIEDREGRTIRTISMDKGE